MPNVPPLPFERSVVELEEKLASLEATPDLPRQAIRALKADIVKRRREIFENLDPWDTVKVARHLERPQTLDYIELVCDEFVELHGDRSFGDDRAIVTGFAKLDEFKVMFIGQHKGRNLKERNECYYGCAHPEGYRKALEKMAHRGQVRPTDCLSD